MRCGEAGEGTLRVSWVAKFVVFLFEGGMYRIEAQPRYIYDSWLKGRL